MNREQVIPYAIKKLKHLGWVTVVTPEHTNNACISVAGFDYCIDLSQAKKNINWIKRDIECVIKQE